MKFNLPMEKGKILKRYKRFLADVELANGEIIVAHTANTGSMKTCWEPGWDCLVSFHDDPKRKLKYSLQMTHNGDTWIGVNTSLPNKLAIEGIESGAIKELQDYETIRPEKKIGDSRIDIYLSNEDGTDCYVEVKNVTLLGGENLATFPDSVSTRGQKHLNELMKIKESGTRACMLYIVQREDVNHFCPAAEIDPEYARLLKEAHNKGVEILVYQCELNETSIEIKRALEYSL